MALEIKNRQTGNSYYYPTAQSREGAVDWFNSHSREELLEYFRRHDGPASAFWKDKDQTVLADDWDDVLMEMWAMRNYGRG